MANSDLPRLLDPTIDRVFRRFFSDAEGEELLVDFLTAVLRPPSPIVDVEWLPTSTLGDTVFEKEAVLDVFVVLDTGDRVNVEMQTRPEAHFEARTAFYWARSLSGSLARGEHYRHLPKAVFVGVLGFVWDADEAPHVIIRPRSERTGRAYTDRFEAHLLQLPLRDRLADESPDLDAPRTAGQTSLIDWFRFFRAGSDTDREDLAGRSRIMKRAHERLGRISTEGDLRAYAEKKKDDLYIIEFFRQKELREAEELAMAEGRAEGARQTRLAMLGRMCATFGIPIDPEREALLESLDDASLERWCDEVLATRRWPGV